MPDLSAICEEVVATILAAPIIWGLGLLGTVAVAGIARWWAHEKRVCQVKEKGYFSDTRKQLRAIDDLMDHDKRR